MSENKTSQSQHEGHAGHGDAFDPLKLWTAGLETWVRITRDNVERLQSFYHRSDDDKRDPMSFWNTGVDALTQVACDHVERLQSFYNQAADFESATYERARKSAKEIGDMVSESVTYVSDVSREWRKMGLETARRSARVFRPEE